MANYINIERIYKIIILIKENKTLINSSSIERQFLTILFRKLLVGKIEIAEVLIGMFFVDPRGGITIEFSEMWGPIL